MHIRMSMKVIFVQLILLWTFHGMAQINSGGQPPAFTDKSSDFSIPILTIPAPEVDELRKEDETTSRNGIAYRIGVLLPVNAGPSNFTQWKTIPGNQKQWRLRIKTPGALATALYFENFHLPQGYTLFIYDEKRTHILGAFTSQNNHPSGLFSTELLPGDDLIIECIGLATITELPQFVVCEILYAYRGIDSNMFQNSNLKNGSATCNVNVNCSEGAAWKNQRNGVVRVMTRVGSTSFWCSGSLINNTAGDFKPYLLTADHCLRNNQGIYATEANLNQWIFYFNYESETCTNPATNPALRSMTGASVKANTGEGNDNMGSDFSLLLLNQKIPTEYQPYYNGWNRINSPSSAGVSIHHPGGEIKKISTYSTQLISAYFSNINQQNMYWQVQWAATANGHGVTEGGSSGAPLFNSEGLIIGQLTGGQASCTFPLSPDYYGKFSYSWESFGTTPNKQLKPWLDPANTGLTQLRGSFNTTQVVANFMADTTVITVGNAINFNDFSTNNPIEWYWRFPGGTPITASERNPKGIKYSAFGDFDVMLAVKNQFSNDTLVRKKYIRVAPGVYPNPARESVNFLLGSHNEDLLFWELYNSRGQLIESGEVNISNQFTAAIRFSKRHVGIHILSIIVGENRPHRYKITLFK